MVGVRVVLSTARVKLREKDVVDVEVKAGTTEVAPVSP